MIYKNHQEKYRINNKGVSLVELIVVMAIMAIMVGVVSISVSMMFSKNAQKSAKSIDDELTEARMLTMTKPDAVILDVYTNASTGKSYIEISLGGTQIKQVELSDDTVIEYTNNNDSNPKTLGSLEIKFDKAKGSVSSLKCNSDDFSSANVHKIKCKAKNKEATVTLMGVTGRHTME